LASRSFSRPEISGGSPASTGGCSGAVERGGGGALAWLPLSPRAPSSRESEEHKAGPWEFTPSHLYDFDDLCDRDFGSDDDLDNPHGDWLDFG
jgi:hypothetical protein